jgi:hypothetical protein
MRHDLHRNVWLRLGSCFQRHCDPDSVIKSKHELLMICQYCPHLVRKGAGVCGKDDRRVSEHANDRYCPIGRYDLGLGDVIAKVLTAVGIGKNKCGGCAARQKALNKLTGQG